MFFALSITTISAQSASLPPSPLRNTNSNRSTETEIKREEIRNKIELRQQQVETKREALNARRLEKKATMEAKLLEIRKRKVLTLFKITNNRYSAAITRLEKLIDRINSRLAIYKNDNPDLNTAAIESQIETASTILVEAKTSLEAVNINIETVLESENPKESFTVLKDELKDTKDMLKEVHSILVHVIGDIKGLQVGNTDVQKSPRPSPTGGEL